MRTSFLFLGLIFPALAFAQTVKWTNRNAPSFPRVKVVVCAESIDASLGTPRPGVMHGVQKAVDEWFVAGNTNLKLEVSSLPATDPRCAIDARPVVARGEILVTALTSYNCEAASCSVVTDCSGTGCNPSDILGANVYLHVKSDCPSGIQTLAWDFSSDASVASSVNGVASLMRELGHAIGRYNDPASDVMQPTIAFDGPSKRDRLNAFDQYALKYDGNGYGIRSSTLRHITFDDNGVVLSAPHQLGSSPRLGASVCIDPVRRWNSASLALATATYQPIISGFAVEVMYLHAGGYLVQGSSIPGERSPHLTEYAPAIACSAEELVVAYVDANSYEVSILISKDGNAWVEYKQPGLVARSAPSLVFSADAGLYYLVVTNPDTKEVEYFVSHDRARTFVRKGPLRHAGIFPTRTSARVGLRATPGAICVANSEESGLDLTSYTFDSLGELTEVGYSGNGFLPIHDEIYGVSTALQSGEKPSVGILRQGNSLVGSTQAQRSLSFELIGAPANQCHGPIKSSNEIRYQDRIVRADSDPFLLWLGYEGVWHAWYVVDDVYSP